MDRTELELAVITFPGLIRRASADHRKWNERSSAGRSRPAAITRTPAALTRSSRR